MWHLAPGLPGRRILRQKKKSVATKKRNASVVRNENAVVDSLCDITIRTSFTSHTCCLGLVCTNVGPYVYPSILYLLTCSSCLTLHTANLICTVPRIDSHRISSWNNEC